MGIIKLDIQTPQKAWFTDVALILGLQLIFYFMPLLIIYSILTLNYQLIILLASISFLQQFIHRSQLFVRLVNKYIQPTRYFRRFLRIYDEEIDDAQLTMFCFHPHSQFIYGLSSNANADDSKMSRMVGLASRFLLFLPITGLQLRLWGAEPVDSANMKRLMKNKKTLGIVPGGYEEATITSPTQFRVFIKSRYGFLKYAFKYGYTIRPTLIYNEHKAFKTFDHLLKFRLMLNRIKLPAVIFFGGFLQIFFPLGMEMVTIVGRGIRRDPKNEGKEINPEQIEQAHKKYIQEIERLHNSYKDEFNESPLVIF